MFKNVVKKKRIIGKIPSEKVTFFYLRNQRKTERELWELTELTKTAPRWYYRYEIHMGWNFIHDNDWGLIKALFVATYRIANFFHNTAEIITISICKTIFEVTYRGNIHWIVSNSTSEQL